jgi:hypothetical protein
VEAPASPGAIVVCQTLLVQNMLDWAQVPVADRAQFPNLAPT